ncbi:hypothetical protein BHE74_00009901 [Ensete ventricosum]|nr:hypothetical protein BHE74_00009901 [Ensete ventricosum]
MNSVHRYGSTLLPDPMKQEPLVVENVPDPLAGEQVASTRTARYVAVPPKIDRRRSISVVGGRLREKSTISS